MYVQNLVFYVLLKFIKTLISWHINDLGKKTDRFQMRNFLFSRQTLIGLKSLIGDLYLCDLINHRETVYWHMADKLS